jgi:hypothetical protein
MQKALSAPTSTSSTTPSCRTPHCRQAREESSSTPSGRRRPHQHASLHKGAGEAKHARAQERDDRAHERLAVAVRVIDRGTDVSASSQCAPANKRWTYEASVSRSAACLPSVWTEPPPVAATGRESSAVSSIEWPILSPSVDWREALGVGWRGRKKCVGLVRRPNVSRV